MSTIEIPREELLLLCAEDTELFNHTFFPQTFRQPSATMHHRMDEILEGPGRYIALQMYRGSAKTTRTRAFCAKRISFGISRTIVFIGNAQKNAVFSLRWLKKHVENNEAWTSFFHLVPGRPWSDEHICIRNELFGYECNVIALGITSQIRGINLDDWRPDLILGDDIDNEETTNTPEQREKTSDLMGSLEKALSPPTEDVNAKMVVSQTPINKFDYINTVSNSGEWTTAKFSCFDDEGRSRWEDRYPTEFLLKEKQKHIDMRKLHLWMREMECNIVSKEEASFDIDWLRYWDKEGTGEAPAQGDTILAIDPASSESKTADDQVLGAVRFVGPDVYVLDYTAEIGEKPDQLAFNFFNFIRKYHPRKAGVETTSYQRTLKWYLEKQMHLRRIFLHIESVDDRRKKSDRIIQALLGVAAHGHLWVHSSMQKLIEQFAEYAPTKEMHDDVLDMVAIAVMTRKRGMGEIYEAEYTEIEETEKYIPEIEEWRAPI